LTLCSFLAEAQQDVLLSQYMFNPLVLNPGYAGSHDYMMATAVYRKQWTGFDGSPETEAVTFHGPLKNKHFGLGFTLTNDHIGVTQRTDANAVFAYHMQLNQKFRLGLGLQGGISSYNYKTPSVVWDGADPLYTAPPNKTLPNFGWGAYLYSRNFYLGLSVPHLLDYDSTAALNSASAKIEPRETRHYYVTTGYAFDGNPDLVVKPSILMKYVANAPVEFDFNVNVMFVNTFWVGASYRTNDAIVGILEFQLSKKLRVGYSYDFTTSDLNKYSNGSHEVMLEYDFGYDIMKMKTPRYF
jgi:type IX secretion system PorP/SprF family membrane protein